MSDYGSLVTEIEGEMSRGTSLTSLVRSAIQEAIRHYQGRLFWFNQERATVSTVVDKEYYAVPSGFRKFNWLFVEGGSLRCELEQVRIHDIEGRASCSGRPHCFAVWRQQYRLHPVPDDAYTLRLFYVTTLGALENDQDTNAWMDEGRALIKYRAKYLLYMNKVRDQAMAEASKLLESETLAEMDRVTAQMLQKPMLAMPSDMPVSGHGFDWRYG